MHLKSSLIALAAILFSHFALAKGSFNKPDNELVIKSCKEVLEIYKSRNKKRLLASQTTSLSEAMYAGYCFGLLATVSCQSKLNSFDAAKRIAELDPALEEIQRASLKDVLYYGACQ